MKSGGGAHLCSPRKQEESMVVLWWIIVGLIAGWATGKIMRGSGYGVLGDILLGIAGAIIGGWIMRAIFGAGPGGMIYTILVAIGGAVVLTWIYRALIGRRGGTTSGGIRKAAYEEFRPRRTRIRGGVLADSRWAMRLLVEGGACASTCAAVVLPLTILLCPDS